MLNNLWTFLKEKIKYYNIFDDILGGEWSVEIIKEIKEIDDANKRVLNLMGKINKKVEEINKIIGIS